MNQRRQLSPLHVDDQAIERISRREPLGDAGADPVLRLLEALASETDGRRQTPRHSSTAGDVLEFRRRARTAAARPDRVVGWRSSVGGLVTLAAVVVGSGGVAAALTGGPFTATTGLRGVVAQVASVEVPSRESMVPLPAGSMAPATLPRSEGAAPPASPPASPSEPQPQPQPAATRSPELVADSGAEPAAAASTPGVASASVHAAEGSPAERSHTEHGHSEDRAVEPRSSEGRPEEPPSSDSAPREPGASESRHVERRGNEPRHVDAPPNTAAAPVLPEHTSS